MRGSPIPAYDKRMAKAKKFELESPAPILDEEDEETLAAIDEAFGTRKLAEPSRRRSPQAVAQVDYRLLYTQRALNDLTEIIGHIARTTIELMVF